MIYTIHQGRHRARPLRFGLWFNRSVWRYKVVFMPSCRYSIPGDDQLDINKLIGAGFIPWWKLLLFWLLPNSHHKESARVGWRYNKTTDLIEIFSYCYVNGNRVVDYICDIRIGDEVPVSLQYVGNGYLLYIGSVMISVQTWHNYSISYHLSPYFGGNKKAPKLMQIQIKPM